MKKRKIEDWITQVYEGSQKIGEKYGSLKGRELGIVAAAVLDNGLAHLIEKKLRNDGGEVGSALGLDGDGRAPLGSFGSRIQMAYLLGLISADEMALFRAFKQIR